LKKPVSYFPAEGGRDGDKSHLGPHTCPRAGYVGGKDRSRSEKLKAKEKTIKEYYKPAFFFKKKEENKIVNKFCK